jgi:hypothetical protein
MANSVIGLHTASLGIATISVANSNLDGSGTLTNLITGGANGTFVKTLIIKAQTDTSQGMIRLFLQKPGGSSTLIREIYVAPTTKSARDLSYYCVIPLGMRLASEDILKVSTEEGDTFNVFAESFDISFITSESFLGSTIEYISNTGAGKVSVANSNLNGNGTLVQILTAASAASGCSGCVIRSIVIKAQQTTTPGMVRLYFKGGPDNRYLFNEVMIPPVTQGSNLATFRYEMILGGSLCIPPAYSIWASTENAEAFSVVCEGQDWKYV